MIALATKYRIRNLHVLKLIVNRMAQSLVTLLVVTMITFGLLATAGGDALSSLHENPNVSEATIEQLRRVYGFDKPLPERYIRWLQEAVRGNLGQSFFYHVPVLGLALSRLVKTLLLAVVALLMAWSIALTLGAAAARRPGSRLDQFSEAVILLTASTPRVVLSLLALAIFSRTSLLALGAESMGGASSFGQVLIPAFVLAFPLVALFLAQVREGLGQALGEDFVVVARAKGLRERDIIFRHALRVTLNPLITIFGYSLGALMSGSVIVEAILGWNGLGMLSVTAVRSRDVPLLMGVLLITSIAVFIGNLVADLLLHWNDPRLRTT